MSAAPNPWPPIGQLFVERGRVTPAEFDEALAEQSKTGERVGEILVRRGRISRIELADALSTQWSWNAAANHASPEPAHEVPAPSVDPVQVAPGPAPVPLPAAPAPAAGLQEQEWLVQELRVGLRQMYDQLAAGEARLVAFETKVAELSQIFNVLFTRLDEQTRAIEELRRVAADQAARIAVAGSALLREPGTTGSPPPYAP